MKFIANILQNFFSKFDYQKKF